MQPGECKCIFSYSSVFVRNVIPTRTAVYFEECFLIFLKALPSGCQIPMFFCSSVAALRTSPKVSVKGCRVSACCRHHNRRRVADKKDKQKNCGEQFWRWLSDGVRSGSLSVNAPDSLVHITGGMIFIPTPEIFFAFLKKTPCSSSAINREDIQREFEKLGRNFCKRDKSLFQCLKYEDERRQGRHKRWSGYLIMARKIYTDRDIPDDSMYLFVSMVW